MAKTKLYIIRHGKTMFNTIGRAQGWSDTPLTAEGERGIHESVYENRGLHLQGLFLAILGGRFRPWGLSLKSSV